MAYLATQKDLACGLSVPVDLSKQVLCHPHYLNLECECVYCAPFSSINAMVCSFLAYSRKNRYISKETVIQENML
jgi:hypothetical protein